jgi:hypothetical protein
LDIDKCRGCKHFAFRECKHLSKGLREEAVMKEIMVKGTSKNETAVKEAY